MLRLLPYLTPADLDQLSMQELYWPAGVADGGEPAAGPAVRAGAGGRRGPGRGLASPAAAGPVEVYVDAGADFVNGPKEMVSPAQRPRRAVAGRACASPARGCAGSASIPPAAAGIMRVDWLRLTFHLLNVVEPVVVEVTRPARATADRASRGARLLQPNLLDDRHRRPADHLHPRPGRRAG